MNPAGSGQPAEVDATPATTETLTPGALLRQERERRAVTLQQAAEDLHLDAAMVEAIEADQYATLGAPVYARGHLRKYATLVGLSPQYIIERYEALSGTPQVPTPIPTTLAAPVPMERPSLKVPLWIAAVVLALALAWALFAWLTMPSAEQLPQTLPDVERALAPEVASVQSDPVVPAATRDVPVAPTEVVAATSSAPAATPASSTATTPAATAPAAGLPQDSLASRPDGRLSGHVQLQLEYREPSWTEIYDASGRRLMFDLGEPGRPRLVSGTPPLRVTLGQAGVVSVRVDNRTIVLPRERGRESARFIVSPERTVRPWSGDLPWRDSSSGEVRVE